MRLRWILPCVAVALLAFSNIQAAEEAATKPATQADSKVVLPKGYWSIMASELKLSDDVRAKIADKLQPLEDWDKANSAKREELSKRNPAASDEEVAKQREQRRALEQERTKLFEKAKADVMNVLTAEQRTAWQSAELYNGVSQRLTPLGLTEAQVKQAKELAAPFAKQLQEVKDAPDKAREIRAAYVKEITTKVLTEDQRKKLESMPERRGGDRPAMGDRPGRGDRGAGRGDGAGQGDRPGRGERGRGGTDRQAPLGQ